MGLGELDSCSTADANLRLTLTYCSVARPEDRAYVRDVAERPDPFVREAVVVAGFFVRRKPHPAELILRIIRRRRHGQAVVRVDDFAVRVPAAVGDPGAGAGAHNRLECRDEPARGAPHLEHGT